MVEQRQTQVAANRMVGPVGQRPAATAAVLTQKEIFGILRRHIWLMISLTILGLIIGAVAWFLLMRYLPRYTAQTYIKVLPPVEKDPMTIGGVLVNKDIQYGNRLSKANLIKQQSTLQEFLGLDKVRETKWFKNFSGIMDVRIQKAFKDLNRHFGVAAQRDAEFILLSMTCGDDEESALLVNEMVSLFLASQGGTKRKEIAEKLARLVDQRIRLERDLRDAEAALEVVRRESGFTDLKDRGDFRSTIQLKLDNLELQQNGLAQMVGEIQTSIEILEKQATGPIGDQVARQVERDPIMLNLANTLASLEAALAGRLTKFGENHRVVRQTQELIKKTEQERQVRNVVISEQIRQSNLQNAQDQLTTLMGRLEELENLREEVAREKADFDRARIQYAQREIIKEERELRLEETKEQIEKLRIMHDDPETPKVQFVGYAPVPLEVSSPLWYVYFPGGTILGLMFGIGLAFLIELLNDLVRTPRDVGRYLHIPLLGVIPDADEDGQLRDVDLYHVVRQAPYSIISESYRRFRANLKLSDIAQSSKTLLVTSGVAGDGKTSVAANLATTFVAENKKVLIIDANFWRPSLHTLFPKPETEGESVEQSNFGLSNFLMAQCGYQEVISSTGLEGFDVITSGPLPSNPAELLSSALMEKLIKEQRPNYDYIIVDGPPVLLVSDAKTLAKFVDGTVLVFNAGATRRGAALRTIREMKQVNATIVGCVLFAVKAMKGGYFHEQFKSYQEYQKVQLARST